MQLTETHFKGVNCTVPNGGLCYGVLHVDTFLKMAVLRDVLHLVSGRIYRRFRSAYCFHHQGDEAVCTCETSVNFHQITRRNFPEDSRHFRVAILRT
jgi:hypothetical protein